MPRLDRLLSRNLGWSRREATRAIREGRIADENGCRCDDPRTPIEPHTLPRTLRVDGSPVALHHDYHLLQHKPLGVVTALRDDRHPTAYELLRDAPLRRDLRPVGRLDKETGGLLLWTTHGPLLHRLTHPRYGIERTYHVALAGPWRPLPADFTLDDDYRPGIVGLQSRSGETCHPALARPRSAQAFAEIRLTTGRFHEVRRIFAALGSEVVGLCRVGYGPLGLPDDLPPGDHRPVDLRAVFSGIHPAPLSSDDPPDP